MGFIEIPPDGPDLAREAGNDCPHCGATVTIGHWLHAREVDNARLLHNGTAPSVSCHECRKPLLSPPFRPQLVVNAPAPRSLRRKRLSRRIKLPSGRIFVWHDNSETIIRKVRAARELRHWFSGSAQTDYLRLVVDNGPIGDV